MHIDIDQLTEDELIDLNYRIVDRLKTLHSEHLQHEMLRFEIGETVCFHPPGKDAQVGTLVKFNKKTVTVITEGGRRWNVSPNLLTRSKPAPRHHLPPATCFGDNVIRLPTLAER